MSIREWPVDERPRERLLKHGAAALSEAELLAIVLRTGVRGRDALDVARDALGRFGGLGRLFAASVDELASVTGFTPQRFAELHAGYELSRRSLAESMRERDALASPRAVRDYLRLSLASRAHEVFVVLYLDSQNRLLACEELFRGTLAQTSVYPREVVKAAPARNAAAVICRVRTRRYRRILP